MTATHDLDERTDVDGSGTERVAGRSPEAVLETSLAWARDRDYAGYDPYDGLNSPILSAVATNWLTRLLAMHGVHRCPVNVRPYLGVPKERNPKGIGLFARSHLNRYEVTGRDDYLTEAETLLDWLADNQSPAFDRPAWGYNFDWQNARKFYLPAYHPSSVVTVFCGRSFLQHHRLTGSERSLDLARGAAEFLRTELNTESVRGVEAVTYTPYDSFVVVNANALVADYFFAVGRAADDERLLDRADELFEFVVDTQTDVGGWYYAVPSDESHLTYDNFHTGFVLESLHEYATSQPPDSDAREAYDRGMAFYRDNLFEPTGAPKFEHDTSYPYDAHAAAQAIITFSRRNDPADGEMARTVLGWALENLFDPEGYFHRRVGRFLTDETPYMRWSQAWMCAALSEYLAATGADADATAGRATDR